LLFCEDFNSGIAFYRKKIIVSQSTPTSAFIKTYFHKSGDKRFLYNMIFVSFSSNTRGVTRLPSMGTPEFTPSLLCSSCSPIISFLYSFLIDHHLTFVFYSCFGHCIGFWFSFDTFKHFCFVLCRSLFIILYFFF